MRDPGIAAPCQSRLSAPHASASGTNDVPHGVDLHARLAQHLGPEPPVVAQRVSAVVGDERGRCPGVRGKEEGREAGIVGRRVEERCSSTG